ncbi:MAG: hypothetical protein AVDCRST_MAG41-814 [uncultured Corynebacteriales bacterium]|uniref:Uncharacterized protein n=1 Tax=uncultured Mycobacteriales bacterium TaxID=581187 RepID=A0A6J4HMW8_9ACTN|nr:MAG: hypothetical protein AVDCRST_MAG41-814 [uncultured Corynebacteriales bacterium]
MAGRTVRAWLLRLLLVLGAAGAVTVMHSLPIAPRDHPQAASFAQVAHVALMTVDPVGNQPSRPDREHHGLEHLCLAILTAIAVRIALALIQRRWPTISRAAAVALPRWGNRSAPPVRPPSLARLCVLRL